MHPFFFGTYEHELFGVYHSPKKFIKNSKNVILFSPIGHEYMRSYRILRILADKLSESGHHVLRFDWFGHGDSCGIFEECFFATWMQDIECAITKLMSITNRPDTFQVGFRLGASILLKHASKFSNSHKIILWEPVINGNGWITSIHTMNNAIFHSITTHHPKQYLELIGFLYSPNLLSDLHDFNYKHIDHSENEFYLVCSDLIQHINNYSFLLNSFNFSDYAITKEPDIWVNPILFDKIIMNSLSLSHIVSFIDG
jgi:pimeloyl-ACP methyl ester carboxylesterase